MDGFEQLDVPGVASMSPLYGLQSWIVRQAVNGLLPLRRWWRR
jgi:hypothetical protein